MTGAGAPRRWFVAAVSVGALALAGCSAGGPARTLGTEKLESALTDDVVAEFGAEAQSVECPSSVAAGAGRQFECDVALDGGTVTYRVTQLDADGQLAFEPLHAVLDPARPAARISLHYVENVGKNVDVHCGQADLAVRVVEPGGTFVCRVVDRQGNVDGAVVTVTDIEGSFSFEIRPGDASGAEF